MILVDTSIWIDHIHRGDPVLGRLLEAAEVRMHPFVIGEIALGSLHQRDQTMRELGQLPLLYPVDDSEVIEMIVGRQLHGVGIGYVDAHLVASCLLSDEMALWTRDRRLANVAARVGVAAAIA